MENAPESEPLRLNVNASPSESLALNVARLALPSKVSKSPTELKTGARFVGVTTVPPPELLPPPPPPQAARTETNIRAKGNLVIFESFYG